MDRSSRSPLSALPLRQRTARRAMPHAPAAQDPSAPPPTPLPLAPCAAQKEQNHVWRASPREVCRAVAMSRRRKKGGGSSAAFGDDVDDAWLREQLGEFGGDFGLFDSNKSKKKKKKKRKKKVATSSSETSDRPGKSSTQTGRDGGVYGWVSWCSLGLHCSAVPWGPVRRRAFRCPVLLCQPCPASPTPTLSLSLPLLSSVPYP